MPNIRFERSAGEQQRYNGEEARPPCPARRSSDNRVLGVLGIVLNGLSVAAGLAILAAMASTIGAFT